MSIIRSRKKKKKVWKNIVSALQQSYLNIQHKKNSEMLIGLKMLGTGRAKLLKLGSTGLDK